MVTFKLWAFSFPFKPEISLLSIVNMNNNICNENKIYGYLIFFQTFVFKRNSSIKDNIGTCVEKQLHVKIHLEILH